MTELSHFKYNRRCSIFSDVSPGTSKDFTSKDTNDSGKDCATIVSIEDTSDKENKNNRYPKRTTSKKCYNTNLTKNKKSVSKNKEDDNSDEEDVTNGSIFIEDSEDDSENGKNDRLDVLKEIFKDRYTEKDLQKAAEKCDNLEDSVSELLNSPEKIIIHEIVDSDEEDRDPILLQKEKKGNKRLFSDDLSDDDDTSHRGTPLKQRKLGDSGHKRTTTPLQPYEGHTRQLKEDPKIRHLKELYPECSDGDLRDVLIANDDDLDNAIASLLAFSTPAGSEANNSDGVSDVIILEEDDSDIDDEDYECDEAGPSKTKKKFDANKIFEDDEEDEGDSDGSDNEQQPERDGFSHSERKEVLSLVNDGEIAEIAFVPTCSLRKAKIIEDLRPFRNWTEMVAQFDRTAGLSEDLISKICYYINERNEITRLMNKCERIAKDICQLFTTGKSEKQHRSKNGITESSLVTKTQYITREPKLVPSGLKLKGYQLTGLNWLIALHKKGVNGILADEMGLGKTIQTIVFLAYLVEQGERGPHLIIVPSSTADNWRRELEKWCPSIRCIHYTGSKPERRQIRDEVRYNKKCKFEVIITTYNMAISSDHDRAFLRKLQFHYAIYDEAHMLKNIKTIRYQYLVKIMPKRMLLLTGTPIQNNLLELMSLLTFVMPQMFYDRAEGIKLIFRENKQKYKEGCSFEKEKVVQAKRIMEPFVMRRLKKDVLVHLPTKHEHVVECILPQNQRRIYDETYESCRKMFKLSGGGGVNGLALVMRLRQAANHPCLIRDFYNDEKLTEMAEKYCKEPENKDCDANLVFEDMQVMTDFELSRFCLEQRCFEEYRMSEEMIMNCGKFHYLDSILPEMKRKGDRVLLFNQFTMTMDITEVYLKTRNYNYLRFDGSTVVSERQMLIDKFNNEEDIFIFLISTRAGGLGINLTSANVVIIYDSDYNPHNDKQAEDRCHRMGQVRDVNVYRLVCKETFEEHIMKRAAEKILLHDDISEKEASKSEKEDVQLLLKSIFVD